MSVSSCACDLARLCGFHFISLNFFAIPGSGYCLAPWYKEGKNEREGSPANRGQRKSSGPGPCAFRQWWPDRRTRRGTRLRLMESQQKWTEVNKVPSGPAAHDASTVALSAA